LSDSKVTVNKERKLYGKLCFPINRYKLEEALLEKDTALENLQRKVCNLQTEMRIIVEENMELSRQLAILNQLVTIQSTRCCTRSGITPSPPTSPSSLPPRSHVNIQFRDDIHCQCKCCLQSQFTDILSPTTETSKTIYSYQNTQFELKVSLVLEIKNYIWLLRNSICLLPSV